MHMLSISHYHFLGHWSCSGEFASSFHSSLLYNWQSETQVDLQLKFIQCQIVSFCVRILRNKSSLSLHAAYKMMVLYLFFWVPGGYSCRFCHTVKS
jgi:hypothetical protein